MEERKSSPPRTNPPETEKPLGNNPRKTGARPTPPEKKKSIPKHKPKGANVNFGVVPAKLSMWGNDQYGDCVSAEEYFKLACESPEVFLSDQSCIDWAEAHGYRDGADLPAVLDSMQTDGPKEGKQQYNDGPYTSVDYTNSDALWSAIREGVIKVAIDSAALPQDAGNKQGWFATGGRPGQFRNTDHCIGFSGAGDPGFLFGLIGLPVPSGFRTSKLCVLAFTWSTMGVVDFDWVQSTTVEGYLRSPNTVYVPPIGPTPPPPPPPTPGGITLTLSGDLKAGTYNLGGGGELPTELIQKLIDELQALLPHERPEKALDKLASKVTLTPQQWQRLLALLMQLLPNLFPHAPAKSEP